MQNKKQKIKNNILDTKLSCAFKKKLKLEINRFSK